MLSSQASDVINQFHIHRLRTDDPVGGGNVTIRQKGYSRTQHNGAEMAAGGNPIHGLSSCVKVHRQKAQLGTTFPSQLYIVYGTACTLPYTQFLLIRNSAKSH